MVPVRQAGDHLVRIHVRRCARTRLKHVDGKVRVDLAGGDRPRRVDDGRGLVRPQQTQFEIGHSSIAISTCKARVELNGFVVIGRILEVLGGNPDCRM